jgi:tRNA U34 5-carboxymethylaminomethyl modifying enzyme MnmG/GidA
VEILRAGYALSNDYFPPTIENILWKPVEGLYFCWIMNYRSYEQPASSRFDG